MKKRRNSKTDQFRYELYGNIATERLFEKYGTHIVSEIHLGGRLEFN
ncbi:MAG: hypothetical protein LBC73_09405 [Oscillospiraceae bacterium]|jgi:hypothetical protein|nr:hypothetical protein [Oscillospiraceae bacterium]